MKVKQLLLLFLITLLQSCILSSNVNDEENNYPPPPKKDYPLNENNYPPPPDHHRTYPSNENNYPPPPDHHQTYPSNENNYPPPSQQSQQDTKPTPETTNPYPHNQRDIKIDHHSQHSGHSNRPIDRSVGEQEYTTQFITFDNNNDNWYAQHHQYQNSVLPNLTVLFTIFFPLGYIIVYCAFILLFKAQSQKTSHSTFISWLKQNPPQRQMLSSSTVEGKPTIYNESNKLITMQGLLQCLKPNPSFSLLELPNIVVQLKVIQETYQKVESREQIGNKVTIKTQFIWTSPRELFKLSNEVLFNNSNISETAMSQLMPLSEEFIAQPTLTQINQFITQQMTSPLVLNNSKEGYYYSNQNLTQPMLNDKRIRIFYKTFNPNKLYLFLGQYDTEENRCMPFKSPITKSNVNLLFFCCNLSKEYYSVCHWTTKDHLDFDEYIQLEEKANKSSTTRLKIISFVVYILGHAMSVGITALVVNKMELNSNTANAPAVIFFYFIISLGIYFAVYSISWYSARYQTIMTLAFLILALAIFTHYYMRDEDYAKLSFLDYFFKRILSLIVK